MFPLNKRKTTGPKSGMFLQHQRKAVLRHHWCGMFLQHQRKTRLTSPLKWDVSSTSEKDGLTSPLKWDVSSTSEKDASYVTTEMGCFFNIRERWSYFTTEVGCFFNIRERRILLHHSYILRYTSWHLYPSILITLVVYSNGSLKSCLQVCLTNKPLPFPTNQRITCYTK